MDAQVIPRVNPIIGSRVIFAVHTPTGSALRMGLCPTRAGLFAAEETFRSEFVTYGGMLVGHLVSGWLRADLGGTSVKMEAGQYGVLDCHLLHSLVGSKDSRLEWVEVAGAAVPEFLDRLAPRGAALLPMEWSASANSLFEQVINDMLRSRGNESQLCRDISALMYDFTSHQEEDDGSDQHAIREAMNYICKNFSKNLTIDDIAGQMGMSKFRFIRSFEKVTGMAPYAYLIQTRIEQAKWVLTLSTNKITDVGKRCGFMNNTTFGVAFKKVTGVTPRQWRQMHQFSTDTE